MESQDRISQGMDEDKRKETDGKKKETMLTALSYNYVELIKNGNNNQYK
jgi:hypothetical protein